MVTPSRFSTSTIIGSKCLVPWLAAQGPLAYSPAEPPARDYFFQYCWILPGIFDPTINLREHRYFGACHKEQAGFLFNFWESARSGRGTMQPQYYQAGLFSDAEVKAPLAAYRYIRKSYNTAGSLLIQHGSYQWTSAEGQPHIDTGEVLLYRGIAQSAIFRCLRFRPKDLAPAHQVIWRKYVGVQAAMLSDSVLSWNTIHDRINRCETGGLRHATWVADELAKKAGLDIQSPGFAGDLWHAAQQSYSLEPMMGERKFGPNYVVVKTPLNNIRITTFFAGESEVKIVDPSRISSVHPVGCEVEFVSPEKS